ncbi:hypothetical protein MNBD_GAMMA05-1160 [hydrothermal vent metagenome]|uniref:Uncharacterized protein n=1 Tax=hydrothermal vent metagenome TaxID=652676 RepID=A0A3B0WD92_9ZZZZ
MSKYKSISLLLLIFIIYDASAALIENDDPIFGSSAITFDTTTDLYWLDISLTTNLSYEFISSEFGAGGIYNGYRYATEEEVFSLYSSADIPDTSGTLTLQNVSSVFSLISLIGRSDKTGFPEVYGITASTASFNRSVLRKIENDLVCSTLSDTVLCSMGYRVGVRDYISSNAANEEVGSWLVKDVKVVPIPPSIFLLISGLIVLKITGSKRH